MDDGYSGTSTSRPAFQRLIQDAQDGKVKTIIVKDFSRFARDYIEAGDYMERIFPFQPVKKDTDNLQAVMNTVGEAGDVMHLSQNVVETFIDRIEVFNDKRVKIHFTFEDVLKSYETG